MTTTTATLTADAQRCGPVDVVSQATIKVVIDGTITVTPRFSHDRLDWVELVDDAFTGSGTLLVQGPGVYDLLASGASGSPEAVCSIMTTPG